MSEQTTNLMDPKDIREARMFAGSGDRVNIPYIPVIRINNKKEEKEAIVDGQKQVIEIPAKKGFLIKVKKGDEYVETYLSETLEGVILKERYEIQSKHGLEKSYYSYEFDTWTEPVKVFDQNKNLIIEAPYGKLKDHFATEEKDSKGNSKKTFELYLVLYLNIDGEVRRFKWKMSQSNKWFDYKNSFGSEDTYVGYKTKFVLEQAKAGDIKFWIANYEKGDRVDLREQIKLQKEVLGFTQTVKNIYNNEDKWQQGPITDYSRQDIIDVNSEEEVSIEDIPF